MGGVVGTGTSATAPLKGQENRSGPNFTLISTYDGGDLTVTSPSGVVFNIMQDKTLAPDPTPVKDATNGTLIRSGTLSADTDYYIANPRNALESFSVVLSET